MIVAAAVVGTGCVSGPTFDPLANIEEPVLSPQPTKEEVVAVINANAEQVRSWRSTSVVVRFKGTPMSVNATMAVDSPRSFRMVADSFRGREADFGSNPERVWFWVRQSRHKHVFTCRHEQLAQADERIPLPFRPDWLMEVMGVIPLDPRGMQLQPDPADPDLLQLIASVTLNDGQPAVKLITVDGDRGRIVAHQLYKPNGELVAAAFLNDYRPAGQGGVELPRKIQLAWPEAKVAMTLDIRELEVNPRVPNSTWEMPKLAEYPVYDLAATASAVPAAYERRSH